MTKRIHQIARGLQAQLLQAGWPPEESTRAAREAWASLYRWHQAGEHVYRVRTDVRTPPIAPDLQLSTAPTVRPAVCYVLDSDQWIVIARHGPGEPVVIHNPDRVYAEKSPTLTWATEYERGLASGRINLRDQPAPADLRIGAGSVTTTRGRRPLDAGDIAPEMLRLVRILPLFYAEPACAANERP